MYNFGLGFRACFGSCFAALPDLDPVFGPEFSVGFLFQNFTDETLLQKMLLFVGVFALTQAGIRRLELGFVTDIHANGVVLFIKQFQIFILVETFRHFVDAVGFRIIARSKVLVS